jgi:D-3-phosphoglycerate dehydrogenase / 2-oxoglutarate reductase
MNNQTVLLTDYAWPDDTVERHIIESADMKLVTGPATPSPAPEIDCLVREHKPSAATRSRDATLFQACCNGPQ